MSLHGKHRAGYKRPGTREWNPQFIGIDGEGYTDERNNHHYFLLACSDGNHVSALPGLSTRECIDFLFDSHARNPGCVLVCYGASYDINMMLKGLPKATVQSIWEGQWTPLPIGKSYRCKYVHRKYLQLSRWIDDKHETLTLYDCISFFQTSFVEALEDWLGKDYEGLPVITAGKARRSQFQQNELQQILTYCHAELRALVLLMESVRDSLARADLRISQWYGPGAIASTLLRRYKVSSYGQDTYHDLPKVYKAARHAFAGGRIELLKYGEADGPIYHYDLNSAYPAVISELPALRNAKWEYHRHVPDDAHLMSLIHIRWRAKREQPFYPFHYRNPYGFIYYPRAGEGWYYRVEVENARAHFDGEIDVLECYCPKLAGGSPFSWVRPLYEHRAELKQAGDPAHRTIKLGLNSLYGKLIQHVGGNEQTSTLPAFHQLEGAGYVTAATRARLYAAAMQNPDAIIAFQTDGIFSLVPLNLDIGPNLGQWTEEETCTKGLFVQSGIYWIWTKEHGMIQHYRGFDKGSILPSLVLKAMNGGQTSMFAPSTRFITMGTALANSDMKDWCSWRTIQRELQLTPNGTKREALPRISGIGLNGTRAAEDFFRVGISEAYALPWDTWQKRGEEIIDGVPGVLYYGEHEDTEA